MNGQSQARISKIFKDEKGGAYCKIHKKENGLLPPNLIEFMFKVKKNQIFIISLLMIT